MLLLRMVKITTVEKKSKSDIITLMAHCPSQDGDFFFVLCSVHSGCWQ
jgi:hypothetical protein